VLYADDTQIYDFCRPGAADSLQCCVANCLAAVGDWMQSIGLQLNAPKTEVVWYVAARQQTQLPYDPLLVGSDLLSPVKCMCDLGISIDADKSVRTHVIQTCSKCFSVLRLV